jgi:hypothetical protein
MIKIKRNSKGQFIKNSDSSWNKGLKNWMSVEGKNKMIVSKKGKPSWNKGLPAPWAKHNHFATGHIPWNKDKIGIMPIPWNRGIKWPEMSGKNHFNWKGGKKKTSGYIYLLNPNHHLAQKNGYVKRANLVAEKCLNRQLTKQELLHHIDGNKENDTPENLYLFTSFEHKQFHALNRKPILKSNLLPQNQSK